MINDITPYTVALAGIRMTYRNCTIIEERSAVRRTALHLFTLIEAVAHRDQLWTSMPREHELNNRHITIGDHLAVTRTVLGLAA